MTYFLIMTPTTPQLTKYDRSMSCYVGAQGMTWTQNSRQLRSDQNMDKWGIKANLFKRQIHKSCKGYV